MLTKDLVSGRFHESSSSVLRSLSLQSIKCLIVCRGPVRKEAMDVFDQMGIREYGILLSEKDSVVYPKCLAPELRRFRFPDNVHRIPDYMGSGQEEKTKRIGEIIGIAKDNGYTHIFAGYGFMAEDAEFIHAIEQSGVRFMGPSSHVANNAGAKDQAKKLARKLRVSVTPGIDNISALALVRKIKDQGALEKLVKSLNLSVDLRGPGNLEEHAEDVLLAGYASSTEIVSIEDLQNEAAIRCDEIWKDNAGRRLRFKYIGGGGGKGQRVISTPGEVRSAVMDILAESKVVAKGANRNFLIELNVESTRHNEIQLIGNGEWSLSLGGRDCSVQMHEQKLLELSLTQEQLEVEIAEAKRIGDRVQQATLETDLRTLARMEQEAERFGEAVKLDSVSTFESIVEGERNYFMEMNTRIQVEHRVTEQVYKLEFENPDNAKETFQLDSLIEAMALLSVHGQRLGKPRRVVRHHAGGEVRLNATNRALLPHAGGVIATWSAPQDGEIRDDQGIGTPNPDTGAFVHYNLAGAYDSNIALVISQGNTRADILERLAEILRRTELRGTDVETNLLVHYGLLSWMIGHQPLVKPSTQFMSYYLAAVGAVAEVANAVELEHAWTTLQARHKDKAALDILALKQTLFLRPLGRLLDHAHLLAGFYGRYVGRLFRRGPDGRAQFIGNPLETLNALYGYLALEAREGKAAAETIWDHDQAIIDRASAFYTTLGEALGTTDYTKLAAALASNTAPAGISAERWERCQASHRGFQLGVEILLLPVAVAHESEFDALRVDEKLEPVFPARLNDGKTRAELHKALAPAPVASSDEILTPLGGHFYAREAPHLPPLAEEGMHFEAGQPLFVIEVMKMFNKVSVPFSGTITKLLLPEADAKIVAKGQPIFKIEPDHKRVEESPEDKAAKRRALTDKLLSQL
ncbi:MAG: biotin/lipoyl-containing protein [Polyangiales bacterium]